MQNHEYLSQSADRPGPDFRPGGVDKQSSVTAGQQVGELPSEPAGTQHWHSETWFAEWLALARRSYHGRIPEPINYGTHS